MLNAFILSNFTANLISNALLMGTVFRITLPTNKVSTFSSNVTSSFDLANAYSSLLDFIFLVLAFSITFNHRGLCKRIHFSRLDTN